MKLSSHVQGVRIPVKKELFVFGTAAMFIAGALGKAHAKVSTQQAAKEVIANCSEKYPGVHSEKFMLCVISEPYTHKSCFESSGEPFDKKNWLKNLEKCAKPIQDEAIKLFHLARYNDLKHFPANNLKPEDRSDMENLFYSDRSLVEFQNKNFSNPDTPKMSVTKENADYLRREWCSGTFGELGMPSQKVFDTCNRLFSKVTYKLNFDATAEKGAGTKPVKTERVDPHSECLDARDYEGCIKVKTSGASRQTNDQCTKTGLCTVTTRGNDSYGFPKPMGWKYRQLDDGRIMYFDGPKRIPHNGEQARYIGYERITRYYQNPRAGTSGTYIGGTSASTNCTGYGSSVNCTTTGSSPTYIPGTSATPGGVRSAYFVNVFDCKDMTYASYKNSEVWIGWKSVKKKKPTGFSASLQNFCKKGDQYILKNMDVLNLEM